MTTDNSDGEKTVGPVSGEIERSGGLFFEGAVGSMSGQGFDGLDENYAFLETLIHAGSDIFRSLARLLIMVLPAWPHLDAG